MEKQIVYVQVEIKSQEDLPKGTRTYFVFVKDDNEIQQWTYNKGSDTDDSINWLENVEWYLQPVKMPTEEEMKKAAEEYEQESSCGFSAKGLISDEFYQGAKWFKDKLNIE